MDNLLSGFITSQLRIKILTRLFLNPDTHSYLRELVKELKASPSQVKSELDQLKKSELLTSQKNGRQVLFSANKDHPLFKELHSMVKKALGMDSILKSIIDRLGNINHAFLIDDYAEGKDSGIIDLVLVGQIDIQNLHDLTKKTEIHLKRKIRVLPLTNDEYLRLTDNLHSRPIFKLWEQTSD